MHRIGMITIGQSPRDDVVPAMRRRFTKPVEIIQRGALDGLGPEGIAALGPEPNEIGIVTRLRDGRTAFLSHTRVIPRMQAAAEEMFRSGAELVVVLCGADWSDLRAPGLIVNPGRLYPPIIAELARGHRLGIIKPAAGQVEMEERRYAGLGIEAVVTWATHGEGIARLEASREAASFLKSRDVDLVWMSCVEMDEEMRAAVQAVVKRPVVLAQSILARLVDELIPDNAEV